MHESRYNLCMSIQSTPGSCIEKHENCNENLIRIILSLKMFSCGLVWELHCSVVSVRQVRKNLKIDMLCNIKSKFAGSY